jgi:hypothetical protein
VKININADVVINPDELFMLQNFAAELQIESSAEMDLDYFKEVLQKASGSDYGIGVRED